MKNLAFHSLLGWMVIILPILYHLTVDKNVTGLGVLVSAGRGGVTGYSDAVHPVALQTSLRQCTTFRVFWFFQVKQFCGLVLQVPRQGREQARLASILHASRDFWNIAWKTAPILCHAKCYSFAHFFDCRLHPPPFSLCKWCKVETTKINQLQITDWGQKRTNQITKQRDWLYINTGRSF